MTGSKHMRKNKVDPNIKAQAVWAKAIDGAGFGKPGDLVMSLRVTRIKKQMLSWLSLKQPGSGKR